LPATGFPYGLGTARSRCGPKESGQLCWIRFGAVFRVFHQCGYLGDTLRNDFLNPFRQETFQQITAQSQLFHFVAGQADMWSSRQVF
jgi:hypothetical protein